MRKIPHYGEYYDNSNKTIENLRKHATAMRRFVIEMTTKAGSGHVASSLSAADIVATVYFSALRLNPANLDDPDRDRFILSKGHASPILYAALCELGVITVETLFTLRQIGSPLQGHPSGRMIGVDASTGSLGLGLSQAVGRALGVKLRNGISRIYAMIGDGECDEGQIWEAALAASHYKLGNLIVFLDRNGYQVDGPTREVMNTAPLEAKWKAFGWRVEEINGHDYAEILGFIFRSFQSGDQPSIAIADTIKGYGVSFTQGNKYHARTLTPSEAENALKELEI
jgi:transketolase